MIIVSEFIADPGPAMLQASGRENIIDPGLWQRRENLLQLLQSAEALIIRNQTKADEQLFSAAPRLKVLGRLGVGLDNIDLAAAAKHGVAVTSARNANAIAVAEYVFAAMTHFARPLYKMDGSVRAGGWEREIYTTVELAGKTLGLIGVGEIGRRVAARAKAFSMQVLAYDPFIGPYDAAVAEDHAELLSLEEVARRSDYLSVHTPLTAATRHMINADILQLVKPEAVLINTSRGPVIDEAALLAALQSEKLRGAALDVRESEPPAMGDALANHPRVCSTPHIAGLTAEAQERTSLLVVADVLRVLRGERAIGAVKLPVKQ